MSVRLLLASLLWLVCATVDAQLPRQVRVRWQGPPSCPRGEQFDRELARLLGDARAEVEASEIGVTVQELSATRYQLALALTLGGEQSRRELELASCADVRHTAALLFATAVELRASEAVSSPVDERSRALAWALHLGLLADVSSLPAISAGPSVGVGYQRKRVRLWGEARYLLPREQPDGDSALIAKLDLFAGALCGAFVWQLGSWSLGPSLELELGYLRARGRGELARGSTGALWGSALPGLLGEYELDERVALAASTQVSLPLWRPQFALDQEPAFYTTSAASFRLGLVVRVKLGFKNPSRVGQ